MTRKMNLRFLSLILILVSVFSITACSSEETATTSSETPQSTETDIASEIVLAEEADAATVPEYCEGFGELQWGESYEALADGGAVEILDRTAEFAGHYGFGVYIFDESGNLSRGSYMFNFDLSLDWEEAAGVYVDIRNELIGTYGLPTSSSTTEGEGDTIYEKVAAGETSCAEMWSDLEDSEGRRKTIYLQIAGTGNVNLDFTAK